MTTTQQRVDIAYGYLVLEHLKRLGYFEMDVGVTVPGLLGVLDAAATEGIEPRDSALRHTLLTLNMPEEDYELAIKLAAKVKREVGDPRDELRAVTAVER